VPAEARTRLRSKIELVRADSLARIPWLVHGFSTRKGGFSRAYGGNALNLGFTPLDSRAAVERNRQALASHLGAQRGKAPWPIVTLRQIHSDLIHTVRVVRDEPLAGDGLLTRTPGLLLAVQTADCLPVILVDTKRRAVGVFHAGWRGTLKRIVEKGVGEMRRRFKTLPRDLEAVIGPGIRACCYQVGPELREAFDSRFPYAGRLFREAEAPDDVQEKYPLLFLSSRPPGRGALVKNIFLDLADANRRQLLEAGVPSGRISDLGLCTSCRQDLFFSHRDAKGNAGRMMAVVGVAAKPDQ
jgi:purine-nucleoside/S-methyl-5'-thioadenosine phosphorylase / adenosine deaminase